MKAEIVVPSSLDDITLEQYQLFMRIVSEEDSEEFLAQKMVSVFCKIRLSDVFKIRMLDVLEIATSIGEMIQKSYDLTPRFKMNDTEFGFITDLENISFEEYVDLDSHLGDWQTMHKAMAVMYRPIVKTKRDKYDIEEYQGSITYSEVMKYAPLSIVLGSMVFFYRLRDELLKATLSYLKTEVMEMALVQRNSSISSGVGTTQSINLLEETLQSLTKLQNYHYSNV
jgi:hypothetical protein